MVALQKRETMKFIKRDMQSMIGMQRRGMIETTGRNPLMMTDETREMSQFIGREAQGRKIENIEGERLGSSLKGYKPVIV